MRVLGLIGIAALCAASGSADGKPRRNRKPAAAPPIAKPAAPAAAAPAPADGDTPVDRELRKTSEEVELRDKPGEKQSVIAKLPVGTDVILEAMRGRWYRVRALNRVGYVMRTSLSEPATTEPAQEQAETET